MTGNDIRVERTKQRLKQLEMSKRTGIPQPRLSLIENEWSVATADEMKVIRTALGLEATPATAQAAAGASATWWDEKSAA